MVTQQGEKFLKRITNSKRRVTLYQEWDQIEKEIDSGHLLNDNINFVKELNLTFDSVDRPL